MTFADEIREHESRCYPHLLRLQFLARREAAATAPWQLAAEVREATNAVLAEAEAAVRTALAATAGTRRETVTEAFLWARLARLAGAADEAVNAVRIGQALGLGSRLRRFGELTSAIWAVQLAVYGQVPLPAPAAGERSGPQQAAAPTAG